MKLEDMLIEISQSQKQILYWFHLHEVFRVVTFVGIERIIVAKGWESGEWGGLFHGIDFWFCEIGKVLEISFTTVWKYLTLPSCSVRNGKDGKCYVYVIFYHN